MATLPRRFGPYLLLQRLARGGMGEIYLGRKARHEGGRYVALKTLRQDLTRDKEYVTRFLDEARVAIILNHPGINRVFDVGFAEGTYFLELEYISGRDVRTFLERARDLERSIPPEICYHIVRELLSALAYLHEAKDISGIELNLIHRDVSPQNAMASWGGDITLIDFGLARFAARRTETEPGMVMGKLRYMAPEQARGGQFDRRVDLFAVGVILYEMLSGRRLYEDVDPASLWEVVARGRALEGVRFDKLPEETHTIVRRALAIDAGDRYPDGNAFMTDLNRLTGGDRKEAKQVLSSLLADLFEVDLRVEREFMDELGRIAPFELSPTEGTQSVSLADPAAAVPREHSASNPFSTPSPPTAPEELPPLSPSQAHGQEFSSQRTAVTSPLPKPVPLPISDEISFESGPFSPVTEPAFPKQKFSEVQTAVTGEETARVEREVVPPPAVGAAAAAVTPLGATPAPVQPAMRALNEERTMLLERGEPARPARSQAEAPRARRRRVAPLAVAALLLLGSVAGAAALWRVRVAGGVGGEVVVEDDGLGDAEPIADPVPPDPEVSPAAMDPGASPAAAKDPEQEPAALVADEAEGASAVVGDEPSAEDHASKRKRPRSVKRRRTPKAVAVQVPRPEKPPIPEPVQREVTPAPPPAEREPKPRVAPAATRAQAERRARDASMELKTMLSRRGLTPGDARSEWPESRKIGNVSTDERERQELLARMQREIDQFSFSKRFIRSKLRRVQDKFNRVRTGLDDRSELAKQLDAKQIQTLKAFEQMGDDPARLANVNTLLNELELALRLASK